MTADTLTADQDPRTGADEHASSNLQPSDDNDDSLPALGFRYGGPGTVGFLNWVEQRARHDGIDVLLLASRNGGTLDRLARRTISDPVKTVCFSGSHTAFVLAAINQDNFADHLGFLLSDADGLAPSEVLERIGVPAPADDVMADLGLGRETQIGPQTMERMQEFLFAFRWDILKICRRNRQCLFRYLISLGVRSGMRIGLADIGWNGAARDALQRVLSDLFGVHAKGYYVCLAHPADGTRRRSLDMEAMFSAANLPLSTLQRVHANRAAIELFFAAPHRPIIGYDIAAKGDIIAIEQAGHGDVSDLRRIAGEIAQGIEAFALQFQATRGGARPMPEDIVRPLIDFAVSDMAAIPALAAVVRAGTTSSRP